MKNNLLTMVLLILVFGAVGFFAGMKYQQISENTDGSVTAKTSNSIQC